MYDYYHPDDQDSFLMRETLEKESTSRLKKGRDLYLKSIKKIINAITERNNTVDAKHNAEVFFSIEEIRDRSIWLLEVEYQLCHRLGVLEEYDLSDCSEAEFQNFAENLEQSDFRIPDAEGNDK